MKIKIPTSFQETILNTWSDKGFEWLQILPSIISACTQKWDLSEFTISEHLSYNLVLFAHQKINAKKVALKLCFPESDFQQEIKVLNFYNGRGAVKLLDFDLEKGALLLEAIYPGTSLKTLFPIKDDEAVSIAVKVMKELHSVPLQKSAVSTFPTIELWLQTLNQEHDAIPKHLLEKARTLSTHLVSTQETSVLLHGDLHHDNILLDAENSWVSIDPKGVIGELAYEIGAFMRNPLPELYTQSNFEQITYQRLEKFSSLLKVPKQRLIQWNFVQAILAACWAVEDKSPSLEYFLNYVVLTDQKL